MKRYPAYQSVDLPWLKEIPANWKLQRNKNFFQESKDVVGERFGDYTLLSLTLNGIIPRDMESGKGKFPKDFDTYKVVQKGDMAFCFFDIDETPRTVGLSSYDGMLTGAYTICHVHDIHPKFAYYYYLALDNVKALRPLYSGLRKTIKSGTFLGTKMPVPPREEQEQIVRFLDWKVSAINRMIACRHRQMDLIDEHFIRQADDVIFHGSQNAALKNSRFSWIGEIPQHWATIKIKWLFNEDDARNENGTAELLTFSRKRGLIPYSEATERPSVTDLSKYRLVKPGQLLENRLQAWSGMFICVTRHGCISPDYSVFNANPNRDVNVKFYEYVFRSPRQVAQFANASRGVGEGFNRLYTPAFGAIETIYPPIEEQNEIIEYLDQLKKKHVAISKKIEEELTCLEELKTRLISDVVTGKLDVRGVDVP